MTSDKNLDGRFKVQGALRCSGVGSLMCAEDKDGARTAIRMVPQYAQGREAVAAVLKFPLHPVLPRALGSGQLNDSAWVALDFPEGVLVTQQWPLELPRLLAMGSAVASALAALHQGNIVHGELSGDSVLGVPHQGGERFVLFDAPLVVMNRMTDRRGEERLLAQLTHIVPFLSPERARGLEADFAADIWALGVLISLAAGAQTVPGGSALEKIASIVTGKWRPAVPATLPIALRLLLTRMLAPEPRARPTSLDVAIEFSNLLEALSNHQHAVTVHPSSNADTNPVGQARIQGLVAKMNEPDPFAALIGRGVSVSQPDVHSEPTRRLIPGADFTDPDAPVIATGKGHDVTDPYAQQPVPTAPNAPVQPEKPEPSWPPMKLEALPAEGLLVPAVPAKRRTPPPLPPILDPMAVSVAPSPRLHSPSPMPKLVAAMPEPELGPLLTTQRFGELPTSVAMTAPSPAPMPSMPAPAPSLPITVAEPVSASEEANAQAAAMLAEAPAKSIHDELEDAFGAELRRARARRFAVLGIAAAVLVVGTIGLVLHSQLSKDEPEARPARVAKGAPAEDEAPVALTPVARPARAPAKAAERKAAVVEAKPAPVVEATPAPVDEAKPAPTVEAKPAPAPQAKAAPTEAKPAPAPQAKAAPTEAKPAPAPQAKAAPAEHHEVRRAAPTKAAPAPVSHRSASRLDEGD